VPVHWVKFRAEFGYEERRALVGNWLTALDPGENNMRKQNKCQSTILTIIYHYEVGKM